MRSIHPVLLLRCAVFALLSGLAVSAHAHDPGLSVADLSLADGRLVAQLTFARRDIEAIVPMDADHDGAVSAAELAAARSQLQRLAGEALAVGSDDRPIAAQVDAIDLDQSDALHFRLAFPLEADEPLSVSAPIIARLAYGHRQYLSVRDEGGRLLSERVLDADTRHDLQSQSRSSYSTFLQYLEEGVWHIWIGFDHILFLLALLLPSVLWREGGRWRAVASFRTALADVVGIVTAFTVAHSITLCAAALGWVALPSRWVESAIAATVVLAAVNNLYPLIQGRRWAIAFCLGLVHGFGFASVLADLGLPQDALILALAGFNLGVEVGQLAIVTGFLPLAYLLRESWVYQRAVLRLGSLAVAVIATVWLAERSLDFTLLPV